MGSMFSGASSLTNLNLTNFNTANVLYMDSMFRDTQALTSLDLTGWILRNPLPSRANAFTNTPVGKVVYCNQGTIGAAFSITCSSH